MVDRRKAFNLISSRDHCQRSSPLRISDTLRTGFEPAQRLSSGFVESSCAVVITTTLRCHKNSKNHPNSSTIWKIKWKFAPPFKIGVVQSIRARWALLSPPKFLYFWVIFKCIICGELLISLAKVCLLCEVRLLNTALTLSTDDLGGKPDI